MEAILILIGLAVTILPMWKLCERAGLAPAWSLACIIPLGLIVLLWVLAYRRWPGDAGA